jgi:hypothetical protein
VTIDVDVIRPTRLRPLHEAQKSCAAFGASAPLAPEDTGLPCPPNQVGSEPRRPWLKLGAFVRPQDACATWRRKIPPTFPPHCAATSRLSLLERPQEHRIDSLVAIPVSKHGAGYRPCTTAGCDGAATLLR